MKKFEEKFKIGDKIKYENSENEWVKILSFEGMSEEYFTAITDEGEVAGDFTNRDEFLKNWSLYREPVEKDLEGFKKYYELIKDNGLIIHIKTVYFRESDFKTLNNKLILSETEAIERGLKL